MKLKRRVLSGRSRVLIFLAWFGFSSESFGSRALEFTLGFSRLQRGVSSLCLQNPQDGFQHLDRILVQIEWLPVGATGLAAWAPVPLVGLGLSIPCHLGQEPPSL